MRKRLMSAVVVLAFLFVSVVPAAHAVLERVGPADPANGYPQWYQDKTGLILDFCGPLNRSEADGGWCLLVGPDLPVVPEVFPSNFFDEHFYWAGTASPKQSPVGASALLVLALEAAFGNGPVVAGDQVVFGRVRVRVVPVPLSGTYVFYTPFGVLTVPDQVAGAERRLSFTIDLGLACLLGRFDCALASPIGPFLLPSVAPGGPELPPIPLLQPGQDPFNDALVPRTPYPGTGRKYIADPARVGPVTGGACIPNGQNCVLGNLPTDPVGAAPRPLYVVGDGTLRDPNIFRVEVLQPGATIPTLIAETTDFSLMGRVYDSMVPGRVTLDRATYAQPVPESPTGKTVDVFATALPSLTPRIPAGPPPVATQPQLVYYDAACGVDPVTGALIRPVDPLTGLPLPQNTMFSALGWKYAVGQSQPSVIPLAVCLEQSNATDVNGQTISIFAQAPVTDQVFITESLYDPNAGSLSVKASSSDQLAPRILTVGGFGDINAATGQLLVTPLAAPPSKVIVVSSEGGLNQRPVSTRYGATVVNNVPVALNDAVTISEDCSPVAARACATPQIVNVLANDTLNGAPIAAGPGVSVTLTSAPRLGAAVVNTNGTIGYTPNPNANGADAFTYMVAVNGLISNVATANVTIAPVNDAPVAVNDRLNAIVNVAVPLNVFANDSDPDGLADLATAVNLAQVTGPAPASITAGAGGTVNFTAPVAGTYTFTYQAQDAGGGQGAAAALLSNVATVTVNTAGAEVIATGKTDYVPRQNRWIVDGTATPAMNQTLTIAFADGLKPGLVIGTAVVNASGVWFYDFRPATGDLDPRVTRATRLTVTGPAGGTVTSLIKIK